MKQGIDCIGISITHICHDGSGKFLMKKRGIRCRDEHGAWEFGGGTLDMHEKVEDCLRRELKEENNAEPISYEFLGFMDLFRSMGDTNTHWVLLVFLVLLDPSKVINNDNDFDSFEDIGWFNLNNLPDPLHSSTPIILERFKDKLPK